MNIAAELFERFLIVLFRFFTGQITASDKAPPAKVLFIGGVVVGLAAVG